MGRSAHNAVAVRSRRTAQHPHVTPATTLSARICIRPVLSPFLYSPYAGLTIRLYPILGYHSLIYNQLISFLVSLDYGSYDPCVPPLATRQRHHTSFEIIASILFALSCFVIMSPCMAFVEQYVILIKP